MNTYVILKVYGLFYVQKTKEFWNLALWSKCGKSL